ncbi:MAG TPA: hypothetical protein VF944_09405 [Candidatus Bathyarchaeia archaeon]
MKQEEVETLLIELCDRVASAKARYAKLNAIEDTIRSVNSLAHGMVNSKPIRDAKELLADIVREQALSEDRL